MGNYEKIVGFIITAIFPALLVSKIANHTTEETAFNILSSATPASAIVTSSGYSFGFICHAKTTDAAAKAQKNRDSQAFETAIETNRSCFSTARAITGG